MGQKGRVKTTERQNSKTDLLPMEESQTLPKHKVVDPRSVGFERGSAAE